MYVYTVYIYIYTQLKREKQSYTEDIKDKCIFEGRKHL